MPGRLLGNAGNAKKEGVIYKTPMLGRDLAYIKRSKTYWYIYQIFLPTIQTMGLDTGQQVLA